MKLSSRIMNWLARNAPALNTVRIAAMRRPLVDPRKRDRALRRAMAGATDAAHAAAVRIEFEAVADALRHGSRATVQELALIKRRWTFPLSEVRVPVHLWHGALDRNAPIAFARRIARELPDATLHVSDSSGHDVGLDRGGEIMSVLASGARGK
jgi:pimeloyl-ACP methyl ester carboxylesterase